MRAGSQIVFYATSFVVALFVGNLFDTAFWQAGLRAEHLLGGKPLPPISEFFIHLHHLPSHLFLLPWLGFVGTPFLSRTATRNYWDTHSFVLRYLAFLSAELLLFFVLLFTVALPFIPYYSVLEAPRQSAIELVVRLAFWSAFVIVVFAAVGRLCQNRNDRNA